MSASPGGARAETVARVAAAATAALLLAFAAWQYAMPAGFQSPWGLNPEGVAHFRRVLRLPGVAMSDARFRAGMLGLLLASLLAYGALCAATAAAGRAGVRAVAALSASLALAFALLCPPSLSVDVYAYVGYARLAVLHHLDPYVATQLDLVRLRDPTAPFLHWPISSPYGPLWTLLSMVPVALLPGASLFVEVVVMKLFAAAALLLLASGGQRLAERLAPGRGRLAFVALALNPLFFIEGPANGHNDLVMMALVLWALAAMAGDRPARALSLAGIGAAVKFVPLLLAPWLVARARRRGAAASFVALAAVLALGPLLVSFVPFWHGTATLAGLRHRWEAGHGAGAAWVGPAVAVAVYALLSAWVAPGDARRAVLGWIGASAVAILSLVGICFPWYVSWPLAAALALPDRHGRIIASLLLCFAAALTVRYALPMPAG